MKHTKMISFPFFRVSGHRCWDEFKIMSQPRPKFFDSPYFVEEYGNWHLTEDAPEDLKKEFEEYMKQG